jgi:hypothetical protein
MREKWQKQMPLMPQVKDHAQSKELEVISGIIDGNPIISVQQSACSSPQQLQLCDSLSAATGLQTSHTPGLRNWPRRPKKELTGPRLTD